MDARARLDIINVIRSYFQPYTLSASGDLRILIDVLKSQPLGRITNRTPPLVHARMEQADHARCEPQDSLIAVEKQRGNLRCSEEVLQA